MYVFGCRLSLLRLCGSDFGIIGSNPTTVLALLWAPNTFRGNFNHRQVSRTGQQVAQLHDRYDDDDDHDGGDDDDDFGLTPVDDITNGIT
jgi:hypothetical protein